MSTADQSSSSGKNLTAQIGLVAAGLLVFGFLLFADKTNLTNEQTLNISGIASESAGSESMSKLPPLAPDPKLDEWISTIENEKDSEKIRLLDSIVLTLQSRNRFGHAADFAYQKVEVESSLQNKLNAGILARKAGELDYIQADSLLFREYSSRSIQLLEEVLEEDPENEEASLSLGLAYTRSGIPQNSMKGILLIRKIVENNPANTEAAFQLGLFSIQTGQYEKAETRFRTVLEYQADHYGAMYQLAVAELNQGKTEAARQGLEKVIQLTKDDELKLAAKQLINSIKNN